jgi:O-antigen ligase
VTTVGAECALVVCIAPLLMFPDQYPRLTAAAVGLMVVVMCAGMIARRAWRVPTPLFWPALALFGMVVVGAAISSAPVVSKPKFLGVVLGVMVARVIVLAVRTRAQLWIAVVLYFVVAAGLLALGALGTNWGWGSKIAWIAERLSQVPIYIRVPGLELGVNPNALGGTILLVYPLLACVCLALVRTWPGRSVPPLAIAAALTMLCAVTILLVLTQSRTSWVSLLVTGTVLAGVWMRHKRWVWVVAVCAVLILIGIVKPIQRLAEESRAGQTTTSLGRVDLWRKGVVDLKRSPWVGIGLNVFRTTTKVAPRPPGPRGVSEIAHVHNVFLQTALDVGLVGLAAYLLLLVLAMGLCLRILAAPDVVHRLLALGLMGNLIAMHLFGLTDAIVLGAKVGVFFWWTLGLVAALDRLERRHGSS